MITEPYHYQNKICRFGTQHCLYPSQTLNLPPRAAIVVPKNMSVVFITHLSSADCCVLYYKPDNLLLVSAYLDGTKDRLPLWLQSVVEYANGHSHNLLLCMDSNAHSELYGPDTNKRGELLEDFILSNSLTVHNEITIPTFATIRKGNPVTSFIDVTISNGLNVNRWKVDPSFNGSDHNTILFDLQATPPPTRIQIRKWSSCKWEYFTRSLQKESFFIPDTITEKKIDKMVNNLYEKLNYAINLACPLSTQKFDPTDKKEWFTPELKQLEKSVAKTYRLAKSRSSQNLWIKYKKEHASFKKACRKAKTKAWHAFTTNISDTSKMAFLSKVMQQKDKQKISNLNNADGTPARPGLETIKVLTDAHFPSAQEPRHYKYSSTNKTSSSLINKSYQDWINDDLVLAALLKFNKKKSPGPDEIKPIIFDHLPNNVIKFLTFIFKCCISLHYTPKAWKETKVIFIPKPGKTSYTIGKDFRPISLSNYFLKCLERLVTWKMDQALEFFPIHPNQHGFTKGKCTESAISNTVNFIEKFIFANEQCIGIFLDISSAFDSICTQHIRKSLLKHGGHPDLVEWYFNYLNHRELHFNLHNESKHLSTNIGFPQGGVCSAKFWLIAFNPAIKIINNLFVQGNGYADDLCVLIGGRDHQFMIMQINRVLRKLVIWGESCNLRFNPSKTVAINFSRQLKTPRRLPYMNGTHIPFSQSTKYLGVILDSKLKWETHINEKISKAKKFLMKMANLTRNAFGPKPLFMRWAYISVVRPMIAYGCLCWSHTNFTDKIHKSITRLNRMGINTYARFPRSTPTQAVEILTDTMPLSLFFKKEALNTRIRIKHLLDLDWSGLRGDVENPSQVSHLKYWNNLIEDCNLEHLLIRNDFIQQFSFCKKFIVNKNSFNSPDLYTTHLPYTIYTDGSKTNDGVGSGIHIIKPDKLIINFSSRLPNYCSVFQAEINAIKIASDYLITASPIDHVSFFVDSQAALLALFSNKVSSSLVADTIRSLNILSSTMPSVTLNWTKAHIGTSGNEIADQLAKDGTKLPQPSDVLLPKQAVRADIDFAIREIWHFRWFSYTEARQSKQFISKPDKNKAKYIYKLNRQKLGRFIRIITGHNNLHYHQSVIDNSKSSKCRFCLQVSETFYHFITSCPSFTMSRREILLDKNISDDHSWSVDSLLRFSSIPAIDNALGARFDAESYFDQQPNDLIAPVVSHDFSDSDADPDSISESNTLCNDPSLDSISTSLNETISQNDFHINDEDENFQLKQIEEK